MKKSILSINEISKAIPTTYRQTREAKEETIWQQMSGISLEDALIEWLRSLEGLTMKNYLSAFSRLTEEDLIDPHVSLQQFSMVNHEQIIDNIKLVPFWTEATKQARAAAYISFTGFLQRRTQGMISKAIPNKEGTNKTFFKIRDKVKTKALSREQTKVFLEAIQKINSRDALIAKLLIQGGKRKGEVLGLQVESVDFDENRINFKQTKTRGMEKVTVINFPEYLMNELRQYIGNRSGFVFITRNGKRICPYQIDRNFIKAGLNADIPFRVTPHVLRVTLVTRLKELKIQDTDIMKITGHANPAQLSSYDKSDMADNATLYHHFV